MTTRRGFLGFLAAAGIAAVAGQVVEAAPAPKPTPKPSSLPNADDYETVTFHRGPLWFDLVAYTGIGSSVTLPNSLGDAVGCVIIKCTTKPSDWFILETDGAEITLPEGFNEAGHGYVAYQFGKEAMPQIQPYLDKLREIQRERQA